MTELLKISLGNKWKDVIVLDEYNGVYSIIAGTEGENKTYLKWVKIKTKNGYSEKDLPFKITLGDVNKAIDVLSELLDYLRGGEPAGDTQFQSETIKDTDVPF